MPEEHDVIARLLAEFKTRGLAERKIAVLFPRPSRTGSPPVPIAA